jgi:hypothetical protein
MNISILYQKIKNILSGIFNWIFPNQFVETVAKRRLEICEDCGSYDRTGLDCLARGTAPCCSECGCSMKWKARCLECRCDLGKWEAETMPLMVEGTPA